METRKNFLVVLVGKATPHLHAMWNRETALILALTVSALIFATVWFAAAALRPFLVAIGAALGTLLAALAGFSPTIKGKLVPAVLASILVGLGTWFTTFDLDRQKNSLQTRLNLMKEAVVGYARDMNDDQRAVFIRKLAKDDLRKRANDGQSEHIADVSDVILQLSPDNGHGLYFSGEAWRIQNKREQMRGEFTKFLSVESTLAPELKGGGPNDCYERASGYCSERTAWIDHMMANDFYRTALQSRNAAAKVSALKTVCTYLKDSLNHFPRGFDASTSFYATQDLQGRAGCLSEASAAH